LRSRKSANHPHSGYHRELSTVIDESISSSSALNLRLTGENSSQERPAETILPAQPSAV